MGLKTLSVRLKGPGSGRETALRALQARGFKILTIKDTTTEDKHTASIQRALNRSVDAYGVRIRNIRITRVSLPDQLQTEMTEQTNLKTKMATMAKEHM